jgi:protein-S-isoprenylcysteine O-methyltransferase Ste14
MAVLFYLNGRFLLQIVPFGIFLLGFFIGIYAIYNNKRDNFNIIPEIKDGAKLVTHGMYRYIRHPMYFSVAVMAFALICYNPNMTNIFLFILMILVLSLKAKKEERLWKAKSSEYSRYKQQTKMIIPYIF